jgi:uncharacterized protein (DUF4415 family)
LGHVGDEYFVVACTGRSDNRRLISAWKVGPDAERNIRRYSAAELERMAARGDHEPTRADAPEIEPDEDFWRHAKVVVPPGKTSVHLRVDADVLAWFKAQGRGHLTRMRLASFNASETAAGPQPNF